MTDDNQELIEDYTSGARDVWELERIHGKSRRRIEQIVAAAGYELRKQPRKGTTQISELHRSIGIRLTDHRYEKNIDHYTAADKLGVTKIRYARMERGCEGLELLDLQNIAAYLGTTVAQLIKEDR